MNVKNSDSIGGFIVEIILHVIFYLIVELIFGLIRQLFHSSPALFLAFLVLLLFFIVIVLSNA